MGKNFVSLSQKLQHEKCHLRYNADMIDDNYTSNNYSIDGQPRSQEKQFCFKCGKEIKVRGDHRQDYCLDCYNKIILHK
jgi:hypothetical protein